MCYSNFHSVVFQSGHIENAARLYNGKTPFSTGLRAYVSEKKMLVFQLTGDFVVFHFPAIESRLFLDRGEDFQGK